MTGKTAVVAIVGRTNVGKSTLFNSLAGRRISIVEDVPGVTRDRNYSYITRHGTPFTLVDTGGLVGEETGLVQNSIRDQAEAAIAEADLILAVFDGVAGVHPLDSEVVDILRRSKKPVLWVINKCEKKSTEAGAAEFYQLGIDEMQFVSAAHKLGIKELVAKIKEKLGAVTIEEQPDKAGIITVAILGKPNVGKSTLINKLIGEDRLVASPLAGTTRDSISIPIRRDGQDYVLIDTAGLRKKGRVDDHTVERYGNLRTVRALAMCDVALLVLDATQGLPTDQDARIAQLIHERGRGMIIVVNKWDAVEKDHKSAKQYKDALKIVLRFIGYAPVLFVSALTGRRCPSVLTKVNEVYTTSKVHVKTSDLNNILGQAFKRKPPPVYHGEAIKLYFAVQAEVAPPTFVLFVNHPGKIGFPYQRYLRNILREHFGFEGSDLKIIFKKRTEKADRARLAAE